MKKSVRDELRRKKIKLYLINRIALLEQLNDICRDNDNMEKPPRRSDY